MSKEAMKLALEALEAMQSYAAAERKGLRICDEAITALREALAEQSAQQRTEELLEIFKDVDQCGPLLGMGQPAQQEPVAFVKGRGWRNGNLEVIPAKMNQTFDIDQPLYTSPPAQRTWVDLTDDEIKKEFHPLHATGLQFARAVLAKSKEKNA